jgi:excisionase family DNA binding protein
VTATRRGWSEADVLALPVVVDLPTAGDVLEIGRSRVYEMARTGELPTLRLGTRYKVTRRQLLEMLGIDASEAGPTRPPAADTNHLVATTTTERTDYARRRLQER